MDVDTRLLRYFAAVAMEGNLTRAAQRLFVSQPARTKPIRQLESQLGVQLFTRSRAGMTLTAAGQALAARVPAMLAGWDQALREAKTADSQAAQVLRVGFLAGAANEATQLGSSAGRLRADSRVCDLTIWVVAATDRQSGRGFDDATPVSGELVEPSATGFVTRSLCFMRYRPCPARRPRRS
jgi:DNA-binding transcriptional LysR family regulator